MILTIEKGRQELKLIIVSPNYKASHESLNFEIDLDENDTNETSLKNVFEYKNMQHILKSIQNNGKTHLLTLSRPKEMIIDGSDKSRILKYK